MTLSSLSAIFRDLTENLNFPNLEGMPQITFAYLHRHVPDLVLKRGTTFHQGGAVLSCEEMDGRVEGRVQGSRGKPYKVRIKPEDDGKIQIECNCPHDTVWCKHAVALAIEFLGPFPQDPLFSRDASSHPIAYPAPASPPLSLDLSSFVNKPDQTEPVDQDTHSYSYALESDQDGLRVSVLSLPSENPIKNLQSLIGWEHSYNSLGDPPVQEIGGHDEVIVRYLLNNADRNYEGQKGKKEWHFVRHEKVGPLLQLLSWSESVIMGSSGVPIGFSEEILHLVLKTDPKDPGTLAVHPTWRCTRGDFPLETTPVFPSYPSGTSWAWTKDTFYRIGRDAARLAARIGGRSEIEVTGDEIPLLAIHLIKNPPLGVHVILSEDVRVESRRLTPRRVLTLDVRRLNVTARLEFDYGGNRIDFQTANPYIGPPTREGNVPVWIERDDETERSAVDRLKDCGFLLTPEGTWSVEGDAALDFVGGQLPVLSRDWDLFGVERLKKLEPSRLEFHVSVGFGKGIDWFSMEAEGAAGVQSFGIKSLAQLLGSGKKYVRLNDGTFAEIPKERVQRVWEAVRDLDAKTSEDNSFKVPLFNALSLLDALEGEGSLQLDEPFQKFMEGFRSFSGIEQIDLPAGILANLRPYQVTGFRWLHFLQKFGLGGILADDMGLGKTLQALTLIQKAKETDGPLPSLIVVPASVVFNWQAEAARFTPSLSVLPLVGGDRHDRFHQIPESDLVVSNYALLRRDIKVLKTFDFRYAILDEAQNIKNPDSITARASRQLQAQNRLVLTGTPIENRLSELWSIFHFLMPGFLLSYPQFQKTFEKPIQVERDRTCEARLRRRIHPFILRRLKQHVEKDLPDKTETTTYCTLLPDQRSLYLDVLETVRQEVLEKIDRKGVGRSHISILSALLRLRQVCCHPKLLGLPVPEKLLVSAKFDALKEQVLEIVSEGHRLLLFSQFVSMLKLIREWLDAEEIPYEYLDGRTRDRQARIERFNREDQIPLFLISLKAGGTGINLTGADYVIHYDPWWNPAVEDQATDRAYRIGQTRNVFVYRLITRGTVEEKILELQGKKRDLVDGVLGVDKALGKVLIKEDVEDLFRLDG